jgi:hypothetical protein
MLILPYMEKSCKWTLAIWYEHPVLIVGYALDDNEEADKTFIYYSIFKQAMLWGPS